MPPSSTSSLPSTDTPVTLQPPAQTIPWKSIQPRPLLALEYPPVSLEEYPTLSVDPRPDFSLPGYAISTHLLPAAWPRCPSTKFKAPSAGSSFNQRVDEQTASGLVTRFADVKETQEQGRDPRPSNKEVLWTVANRVYNTSSVKGSQGLTLVMIHGVGNHKESWEPTLKMVLSGLPESSCAPQVDEVWMLDAVQHGDSAFLNEETLGDTFDCADYSRDVMNFILAYLPRDFQRDLPTNLRRVSNYEIAQRKQTGVKSRNLVAIGHSVGASAFVHPATLHPKLFSSLILVEPICVPEYRKPLDAHRKYETRCLQRKWVWKTWLDAVQDIGTSPYYRTWNFETLETFLMHAIVKTPDGFYRFKAHPFFESIVLFDRSFVYETWQMLADIDPQLPIHWIWGGKSKRGGGQEIQAQTTFRHPGLNTNVWHPGIGHLVRLNLPGERPVD
jgi:pimeloyl-ACP methyl ester carboxylesterase